MLVKIAGPVAKISRENVIGAAREAFVAGKDTCKILVMGAMGRLVVIVAIDVC